MKKFNVFYKGQKVFENLKDEVVKGQMAIEKETYSRRPSRQTVIPTAAIELQQFTPLITPFNEIEQQLQSQDAEVLRQKTAEWKAKLSQIQDREELARELDAILPEAFAVVKNACRRLCGSEVQVRGHVAKMRVKADMVRGFLSDAIDEADLRVRVQAVVDSVLAEQGAILTAIGDDLVPLLDALGGLLLHHRPAIDLFAIVAPYLAQVMARPPA